MMSSTSSNPNSPAPGKQHEFYAWCTLALFAALFAEMLGTVAFTHMLLPEGPNHVRAHLLFNIASGVFAVVTMFAIFISELRRRNDHVQQDRWQKLQRESSSGCHVIDEDTNTFTREYFDRVLLREIGHTSVSAKSFCVLQCALGRSGEGAQREVVFTYLEHMLAQILRNSVRASDYIAHTAKGEFLILLSELNEHTAQIPVERIHHAIDRWNRNSGSQRRLKVRIGLCEYDRNLTPSELLLQLSQRCQLDQYSLPDAPHRIPPAHVSSYAPADSTTHVC